MQSPMKSGALKLAGTFALAMGALLAANPSPAQVSTQWANEPGGVAIARDAHDNLFTARGVYNPGGDIFVAKRNAAGALLWEVSYDNTDSTKHELATWVATDSAGNVVVSGTIKSGFSNPVNANSVVMKFSAEGTLLWRRVYETPFDGSSTRKVLVDAADNVYVLGLGGSGTPGLVTTIRKFDRDGNAVWTWRDSAGIGAPLNFKFTPDAAIVVTGRGTTGSINGFAKVDLGGNTLWSQASLFSLTAGDAAGDLGGNTYLITGTASGSGTLLRKLAANGEVLWERQQVMAGLRVEVGSDNAAVISGYPGTGSLGAAFMKYDAIGNVLWTNLDADGPAYVLLAHAHLRLDAANNAYLAAGTMSEMAVVRINADGTLAWTSTASYGYAQALELGTDNAVYVVGGTTAKFSQSEGAPADLSLTLDANPRTIYLGESVTVTSRVANQGPNAANSVTITGTLPGCALGTLAVGASASCSRAMTPVAAGTLIQSMMASSSNSDPHTANNSASTTVQVLPPNADLRVSMTHTPESPRVGGTLVYTVSISNAGPNAAQSVNLNDRLPDRVSLQRVTTTQGNCTGTGLITCSLGNLAAGGRVSVTISVRPRRNGVITNTATVESPVGDAVPSNNTVSVTTTVLRR